MGIPLISGWSAAVLLALSVVSNSAFAVLVNFEGSVDTVSPDLTSVFNTNMTIDGSLNVDDSVSTLSGPTFERYSTTMFSANVGSGAYTGTDAMAGNFDVNNTPSIDILSYLNLTLNDSTFASIGSFDPFAFSIRLDDQSATALNDTSFPSSIDVNDFPNLMTWALSFEDRFGVRKTVRGTLTSLTVVPPSAVPVPAAVWLFATAIAGIAGFSRRHNLSRN
jgi:hypothetical protein